MRSAGTDCVAIARLTSTSLLMASRLQVPTPARARISKAVVTKTLWERRMTYFQASTASPQRHQTDTPTWIREGREPIV